MRPLIIGNWKMNKTAREASDFVERLGARLEGMRAQVWLALPFTSLHPAAIAARGTPISIGAQNLHEERQGSFTGEISALMLKEAGATFALVGHAERRHLFHETHAQIAAKLKRALADDLNAVLCVGEQKGEPLLATLTAQVESAFAGLAHERVILAYEPVWAIGADHPASLEHIVKAHAHLRSLVGASCPILYGGSVKPDQASKILRQQNVGGLLVGSASLDLNSFHTIITAAE